MMSQYIKFHDETVHILSKLPHTGIDELLYYFKKNKITLYDLYTYILTDDKINQCITITRDAFDKEIVTFTLLYQTEVCLQELALVKEVFLSQNWGPIGKSIIPCKWIDLLKILSPPVMQRIYPKNRYPNVFSDLCDVHHIKQPNIKNITNGALEMMDEIAKVSINHRKNLEIYHLANIHFFINSQFFPKKNSYLFSIFNTLKTSTVNDTTLAFIIKALLQMIIRLTDPQFKTLITNSDFEDVVIFRNSLIAYKHFDSMTDENSLFQYIHQKELKYSRLMLNIKILDKQILKLLFKLGALCYAKEKIVKGDSPEKIISDIRLIFGPDVFKHRFTKKSTLHKNIEKMNHTIGMFKEPIAKEEEKTLLPEKSINPL